jgi:hypothetical protein
MSGWTAEDFKFVHGRMKEIKTEENEILTKTRSEPSQTSSDVSRAANNFRAINDRMKTLGHDGTPLG